MAKTLTLSLNKKLIIEAVKADTYITGTVDKSLDPVKNAGLAYNEQAGDDTYHERKLTRTLHGAVGSLEANLAEFVDTAISNGITDTLATASEDGAFTITVMVSDRYNSGLSHPISQLAQEYVINKMLYSWWQAINSGRAKEYVAFTGESLASIRLCLAKTAPTVSSADYEDVTGSVDTPETEGTVTMIADIAYTAGSTSFVVPKANLIGTYTSNGNATVECTDKNAAFLVQVGGETVFSIAKTPYSLTENNYVKLSVALGESGTEINFVPTSTISSTNKLLITALVS